jgi:hypothetical protein
LSGQKQAQEPVAIRIWLAWGEDKGGKTVWGSGDRIYKNKKIKKYYILKIVCMNFTKKRLKNYIDRYVMGLKRRE